MPGAESGGGRASVPIGRRVRAAVTERLGYKGAALFFALVLWLIASAEEPSEELVPVRLEAEFDSNRALVGSRPPIRALVAGRARDLIKLYDTPPVVRRIIPTEAPDTTVVDIRPSDVYIPPGIEAIVRDVQPRTLVLAFDVTATRVLPVENAVHLIPDSGAGPIRITSADPESVTVSGPRSTITRLRSVRTVTDTLVVRDTGALFVPIDLRQLGAKVRVNPDQVRLSVVMPAAVARPDGESSGAATANGPPRVGRRPPGERPR